jgi:uncharacterized membrane protein
MYSIHPFTVHFPVALLLANGLFTWLYLRGQGKAFETSAYHCLLVGWLGAVVAVLTGAWDAWRQVYGPQTPNDPVLLNWVNVHAAVGIALVVVYGQALLRCRRDPRVLDNPRTRKGYLRLIIIGLVLVLVDGWIGARLVYGFGLGVAN